MKMLLFQALSKEATSMNPKFVKIKEKEELLKQEACFSEEERRKVGEEAEELCVRHSLVVENCQANKIQWVVEILTIIGTQKSIQD